MFNMKKRNPILSYMTIDPQEIIKIVLKELGVPLTTMLSKNRRSEIIYNRHILAYFIHKYSKLGVTEIGKRLEKNHATIINSCKRIEDVIFCKDKDWYNKVVFIDKILEIRLNKLINEEEQRLLRNRAIRGDYKKPLFMHYSFYKTNKGKRKVHSDLDFLIPEEDEVFVY